MNFKKQGRSLQFATGDKEGVWERKSPGGVRVRAPVESGAKTPEAGDNKY